jgi:site-specific recombinase XerD
MIKEQKINALIESCTNVLREEGYSESNITWHQKMWRRVCKYMEEHSMTNYSADVGELFLDAVSERYPSHRRMFRRSVYLLSDYLHSGKIRERIVQYVNHELSGEIGEVAKRFITSLTAKRYKQCTLKEHQRILSYFIKHLSIRSVGNPSKIEEKDVLSFMASTQNCKKGTLNTIRLFCRYLYEQKIVEKDITYIIGKNNYPRREKLPSVYRAEEIQLIESSVDMSKPVGKRDYAILLLTTRLGLRASDIAGLQFSNLNWESNIIHLSQYKTKRDIELPLLADVGEAIVDYLRYGRPVSSSQQVFLSAVAPYRPINRIMINGAISRIITSSNVCIQNRRFGPHAMRHTLASQLLRNGTALPVISETLGHANTQTTMEYLRVDFNGLMNCALDVPLVSDKFYSQKGGMFYE